MRKENTCSAVNFIALLKSEAKGGGIWLGELEDLGFILIEKDKPLAKNDKHIKNKVKIENLQARNIGIKAKFTNNLALG